MSRAFQALQLGSSTTHCALHEVGVCNFHGNPPASLSLHRLQGRGTMPDGQGKYAGSWHEDAPHGQGTCFYANGDKYQVG